MISIPKFSQGRPMIPGLRIVKALAILLVLTSVQINLAFAAPPQVDLAVTKTVSNAAPIEGDTIVYTITVTNNGPNKATGIQIQDLLPVGVTYVSDDSGGAYDPVTGKWKAVNLISGASTTLNITATVDVGTLGMTITNTASVGNVAQTDTDPTNDSDSASITVVPPIAQYDMVKTSDTAAIAAPGTITYTFTFTNTGNVTLADLTVVDPQLDAGTLSCNADLDADDDIDTLAVGAVETCSGTYAVTQADIDLGADIVNVATPSTSTAGTTSTTVTVQVNGDVAVEADETFFVNLSAPVNATINDVQGLGTITNDDAFVSSLLLTKTATPDEVVIGDVVQYTLQVENSTSVTYIGTRVIDNIPGGFGYVRDSALLIRAGSDGILNTGDDVEFTVTVTGTDPIRFENIDIASNETLLIRYLLRVSSGVVEGEYTNTAQVVDVGGTRISNAASATVRVIQDSILQRTTIIGKVFNDRDADGWQDSATATGVKIKSDYFGWDSHLIGTIAGRTSQVDPLDDNQASARMPLNLEGDNSFHVVSDEGTVIKVDNDGNVLEEHVGKKKNGLTAQDLVVNIVRAGGGGG